MSPFLKKHNTLSTLKSLLIKKLHKISLHNNFRIYTDITLYDHNKSYTIALIILDEERGIYIFEAKDWSYDELKNSQLQKFKKQLINRLAFEKVQNIILSKLQNKIQGQNIPIFKFLLMENLNIAQYDYLDNSFHDILPKEIILFNDMTEENILKKLKDFSTLLTHKIDLTQVSITLFPQYSIKDAHSNTTYLCSEEQIELLDAQIKNHNTLNAPIGSGRTSILLLKSVIELFNNRKTHIVIIKPTPLASQRAYKQLSSILKQYHLEEDEVYIEILTPIQVVNRHLNKLGKKELNKKLEIDTALMNKKFYLADQIFCDDVDFIETTFIHYLIHIQKEKPLLFVSNQNYENIYRFTKSFRLDTQKMNFIVCEPYKKMIELVINILKNNSAKDIIIVTNNIIGIEILKHQINTIDNYNTNEITISTYGDIYGLNAKFVLLMNSCIAPLKELAYSSYLAKEETYILYDEECEQINSLRKSYESSKN